MFSSDVRTGVPRMVASIYPGYKGRPRFAMSLSAPHMPPWMERVGSALLPGCTTVLRPVVKPLESPVQVTARFR